MEAKQQDILSLKRSRGLLSLLLLQSLLFSISLKVWSEGQLVGMQFNLLKCSNYLNIHQAGKQRQSEFPLLKCYNMGPSGGRGGEKEKKKSNTICRKRITKRNSSTFRPGSKFLHCCLQFVQLQLKSSLFLKVLCVRMR